MLGSAQGERNGWRLKPPLGSAAEAASGIGQRPANGLDGFVGHGSRAPTRELPGWVHGVQKLAPHRSKSASADRAEPRLQPRESAGLESSSSKSPKATSHFSGSEPIMPSHSSGSGRRLPTNRISRPPPPTPPQRTPARPSPEARPHPAPMPAGRPASR